MAQAITHTYSTTLGSRLRSLFEGYKDARQKRIAYRQTVSELISMSDRELRDLGFSRYEIHSMVHRHVYGD